MSILFVRCGGISILTLTMLSGVDDLIHAANFAIYIIEKWNYFITSVWGSVLWFLPDLSALDANVITILALLFGVALRSSFSHKQWQTIGFAVLGFLMLAFVMSFKIQTSIVHEITRFEQSIHVQKKILEIKSIPENNNFTLNLGKESVKAKEHKNYLERKHDIESSLSKLRDMQSKIKIGYIFRYANPMLNKNINHYYPKVCQFASISTANLVELDCEKPLSSKAYGYAVLTVVYLFILGFAGVMILFLRYLVGLRLNSYEISFQIWAAVAVAVTILGLGELGPYLEPMESVIK